MCDCGNCDVRRRAGARLLFALFARDIIRSRGTIDNRNVVSRNDDDDGTRVSRTDVLRRETFGARSPVTRMINERSDVGGPLRNKKR